MISVELKHGTSICLNQNQFGLIKTMAKLSNLILFTMIVSIVSQGVAVYNIIAFTYQSNISAVIFRGLDCAMNALCLLLQWPFSQKYYTTLCNPCDKMMTQCCASNMVAHVNTNCNQNDNNNKFDKNNNELVASRTASITDNNTVQSASIDDTQRN